MRKLLIIAIPILFVLIPLWSWADTYYVTKSGSDSNGGTNPTTDAWLTISHAESQISGGDDVIVYEGTYAETVTINGIDGSSADRTLFQANSGDTVLLQGRWLVNDNYITIDGFEVSPTGSSCTDGAVHVTGSYATIQNCEIHDASYIGIKVSGAGGDYAVIQDNDIYIVNHQGIQVKGGSDNATITRNEVHDIRDKVGGGSTCFDANGINADGNDHLISENYVHTFLKANQSNPKAQDGVHFDAFQTAGTNGGIVIERNHFYMGDPAVGLEEPWPNRGGLNCFMLDRISGGITIRNNILESWSIMNTGAGGTNEQDTARIYNNTSRSRLNFAVKDGKGWHFNNWDGVWIYNNITIDTEAFHWKFTGGSNQSYDHNLMWNSDGSTPVLTNYKVQSHDQRGVDPRFVDANSGDYHLRSESPCIDAGTAISGVTDDFDGKPRPLGEGFDIGAYEFGIDPDPPAPPTGVMIK